MIINYKEKQITKKTKSNAESKKRISWIIIPTNCFCVRLAKKTLTSLSEKELLIKLEEYIKFINLPKEFKSYINESEIKVGERERYKMLLKLYNIKKEDEKGTYYEKLREKNPFIAFWLDAVEYLGRKKNKHE